MSVRIYSSHRLPVICTEEDKVLGFWRIEFIAQYIQKLYKVCFKPFVRPCKIKACVGFQNMDMGIHRLGCIPAIDSFHITYGVVPVEGFDISHLHLVVGILLKGPVKGDRSFQALPVTCGTEMLRKAINTECCRISHFCSIHDSTIAVNGPEHSSVFLVYAVVYKIFSCIVRHVSIFLQSVLTVCSCKCP